MRLIRRIAVIIAALAVTPSLVSAGPESWGKHSIIGDENGAFTGRGELTATITLAADGKTFTQDTAISVYDADGNFLFSFCGKAAGTRSE